MERGPTNPYLKELIEVMERDRKPFWKRVAHFLAKPRRQRVAVNVSKINKYSQEGKTVVVPGKVLGDGPIEKPVVVVAFTFSKRAKEKIEKAGGKAMLLQDYYKPGRDVGDHIIII